MSQPEQNTEIGSPKRRKMLKLRKQIYLFLNWPSPVWASVYHIVLCFLCVLFLAGTIIYEPVPCHRIEDFNHIQQCQIQGAIAVAEILLHIWLILELVLRVWSSGCRICFQGFFGKLKFCFSFSFIIDLISILIGALALIIGVRKSLHVYKINEDGSDMDDTFQHMHLLVLEPEALKALLFAQILRLWRFTKIYGGSLNIFPVIKENLSVLLTVFQIGLLGFLLFPLLIRFAEPPSPSHFRSVSDSLWWSVVTLTTVGYGDLTPITILGKAIGGLAVIFGCFLFILPAVIVGSGLVDQGNDAKHRKDVLKSPAVALILAKWRQHRYGHLSVQDRSILGKKYRAAEMKWLEMKKLISENVMDTGAGGTLLSCPESSIFHLEISMFSLHNKLNSVSSKMDAMKSSTMD